MAFNPRLVGDRVYLVPETRGDRFVVAHILNPSQYDRVVTQLFDDTGIRLLPRIDAFIEYILQGALPARDLMVFDQPRYYFYFVRRNWTDRGLALPPVGSPPDPITPNEDPERPGGD